MNILIICRFHFLRTISKLVQQTGDLSDHYSSTRYRMESLLTCSTREEYFHLIDLLEGKRPNYLRTRSNFYTAHKAPKVAEWARHKRHSVIAAGLNKACSLMKSEYFEKIRNITNAVEQSHYMSYYMGTYDTLLGATLR